MKENTVINTNIAKALGVADKQNPVLSPKEKEVQKPMQCPICQQDNFCQQVSVASNASGNTAENTAENASKNLDENPCWCMNESITFSEFLLSKVPEEQRNKACICQQCALKYQLELD